MNIDDLKSELDTLEERVTSLEESNPFKDDPPLKHEGADRFDADDGGLLPFEVSPRLEVKMMMPKGCDLTSFGSRTAENEEKPETFWIDVVPSELLRVADVFERISRELRAIHARREVTR